MKASNFIASTAAAVAVAGAIGFAYAQSTTTTPPASNGTDSRMNTPGTTQGMTQQQRDAATQQQRDATTQQQRDAATQQQRAQQRDLPASGTASGTTGSMRNDSTMSNERQARADRN